MGNIYSAPSQYLNWIVIVTVKAIEMASTKQRSKRK